MTFKTVGDEIWYDDIKIARFEGGWPTIQDRARQAILEVATEAREEEIQFATEEGFQRGLNEGYEKGYETAKKDLWVTK